jgi:hypothetical protein
VPKSRPHREQKKLAWPLLTRLYTKVGPVTGVGGSSRKMWILARIVRLRGQVASKIGSRPNRRRRREEALVLYNQREKRSFEGLN